MENHSKTIARNTAFLYIRTIVVMLIAIYTSRVLLEKLGVENFGIYNLVGGVVALFSSLRGIFAQSVQRFLNFERGKGNEEKVRDVFNISLIIHLGLAFLFSAIVVIFGIWYIPRYLVFPEGMLSTAMFVFYCSIMTTFIIILTTPYDSVIIANEKFDFFAVVSILETLARLGIIYLISSFGSDKLRTYAILILVVTLVFRIIHIVYTIQFDECKFKKVWNKQIFRDLAIFSGWNFLGNSAFSLTNEGINFIINFWGGVTANAARGLAYQVKSSVMQLSSNVVVASKPFVTEAAASKDDKTIFGYIIKVTRLMYAAVAIIALPLIVYTEQILDLWLVEVPPYTSVFVRLIMIHMVIRAPQPSIDLLFSSYAKMKNYQIAQSVFLATSLPLAYILLKIGFPIYWAFISMCIVEAITLVAIVICADRELGFTLNYFFTNFVTSAFLSIIQLVFIGLIFYYFMTPHNVLTLLLCIMLLVSVGILDLYVFYMTKNERQLICSFIKKNKINNK